MIGEKNNDFSKRIEISIEGRDIFKSTSLIWFGQYHITCGYDLVVMILASQASHTGSNPVTRIKLFFKIQSILYKSKVFPQFNINKGTDVNFFFTSVLQ